MIRVNILCMEYIDVAINAVECMPTFVVMRVFTSIMPCVDVTRVLQDRSRFIYGGCVLISSSYEIFTKHRSYI
jgi:hypothetical protein